ncbi:LANO_0E11716g1_1 [Lachancea nothofagi CBS 11611]|uniref:LANO_0E11716g1_1 n=1 Tax=Lachancea nothofagi CBS 11611 TaxID=1266666 RepID=A0A1G4JXM9_9SACH|nr:LANO_0E11716g1_1 [Lachancea nothofagi CBS 11611]
MTSVDYRFGTEDPELLFQFSSPLTRQPGMTTGANGSNIRDAGAPSWTQTDFDGLFVPRDASLQLQSQQHQVPVSSVEDSETLNDNDGALMDDDTETLYATSVALPSQSLRPVVAHAETSRNARARDPRVAPKLANNVRTLSQFNNVLNQSLSPQQQQHIERMVDEFWMRDSMLTEDMFEDSSDEEA